ncbi:MAG: cyclic nucleotide-binding domain-containing protein [Polyangiaceae bacterium]|nr:cyclic nucleotide-binding domain-containing protein [Polyangiaceae bacterium]
MLVDAPILGVRDNLLLLRSLPAFMSIEDAALNLLAEHARVRRVREGERILDPASPIDRVYVVIEGEVRWTRGARTPKVAGRHDVVGWIALMAREEGIEAIAKTEAVVLELPAETLERALEDHFPIVRNTMRLGAASLVRARGNLPIDKAAAPPAQPGLRRETPRSLVERVMGMRTAPIFKRASVEAVIALARNWTAVRAEPGDILWRVGDDSSHWLIIDYGVVTTTSRDGDSVDVGSGFVLGILDSIARLPRSYEARAATEIVASRIELEGFLGVLETHFDLARDFIAYLAREALDRP